LIQSGSIGDGHGRYGSHSERHEGVQEVQKMRLGKFRSVLAAVVVGALVFGGCSGSAGGGSQQQQQQDLQYSYWGSGERIQRTQAVMDLFMKANPDIKILGQPREFVAHWQQLTIQGAAKGAPCIPQMQNRYMGDYSSRNQLRALDDLVASGKINVKGIPEAVLATGRGADGKLYNAVTGVYFYVQFYNADVVTAAGMKPPTNEMNWQQWEAWLRELAKKLPASMKAADLFTATDFSGAFFNYVYSNGQEVFTKDGKLGFDEKILADWWRMWDQLRKDGVSTTAQQLGERDPALEQSPLATAKVAWNAQPQNQLTQVNNVAKANKTGTFHMVKLPNGTAGAGETFGSNGLSISVSCSDASVASAAKFVDFFVNDPEAAKAYGSTNGAVSKLELQTAQISDPSTDPSLKEGLELLQTVVTKFDPKGYVFPAGGRAASDAFTRGATSVLLGQATPEAASKQFIAEANAAMASTR